MISKIMFSFCNLMNLVISLMIIGIESINCVGICSKTDRKTGCCINYHKSNGTCVMCPRGTYGENCSELCPANIYGELCLKRCDCKPHETCDRVNGCIPNRGVCGQDRGDNYFVAIYDKKTGCCINYHKFNGICVMCPRGTYGENCSELCPANMYGELCLKRCDCKPHETCDRVNGCIPNRGVCGQDRKTGCCINYHKSNGICVMCPRGTYGENCSELCPANMYGELCLKRCDCKPHETCDRVNGCIPTCPLGTYGKNCDSVCPEGHYGLFCGKKCHCAKSVCDKVSGCSEKESYIVRLAYWIVPLTFGFIIFIIGCIYRRFRRKPRDFVFEYNQRNQVERGNTNKDDLEDNESIVKKTTNTTVNNSRGLAVSYDSRTGNFSDADFDGTYNTLTLRVIDYEEPIKHEERRKTYSETSSLYIKYLNGRLSSSSDDENDVLVPPLQFTRNTDESMQSKIEIHHQSRTQAGVDNEFSKRGAKPDCSSEAFTNAYMYDKATFEDTKIPPPRQQFLKELSSRLINQMT